MKKYIIICISVFLAANAYAQQMAPYPYMNNSIPYTSYQPMYGVNYIPVANVGYSNIHPAQFNMVNQMPASNYFQGVYYNPTYLKRNLQQEYEEQYKIFLNDFNKVEPFDEKVTKADKFETITDHKQKGYGTRYFPGMEEFPKVRPIEHKSTINADETPLSLLKEYKNIKNIHLKLITADDTIGDNLQWDLPLPYRYIFLKRFSEMADSKEYTPEDDLWGRNYQHLEIHVERNDGKVLPVYFLYKNSISVNNKTYVDNSKTLESWIFATVKDYQQLSNVNEALNVRDFNRCKELGNLYHETDPEQCITPNGITYLNVNTEVNKNTKLVDNFEDCFEDKNPVIAGYPRRCIAPGGKVYTEQPKVK